MNEIGLAGSKKKKRVLKMPKSIYKRLSGGLGCNKTVGGLRLAFIKGNFICTLLAHLFIMKTAMLSIHREAEARVG